MEGTCYREQQIGRVVWYRNLFEMKRHLQTHQSFGHFNENLKKLYGSHDNEKDRRRAYRLYKKCI